MVHRGVAVLAFVVAISPAHAGLIEYSFSVELDRSTTSSTFYDEFGAICGSSPHIDFPLQPH